MCQAPLLSTVLSLLLWDSQQNGGKRKKEKKQSFRWTIRRQEKWLPSPAFALLFILPPFKSYSSVTVLSCTQGHFCYSWAHDAWAGALTGYGVVWYVSRSTWANFSQYLKWRGTMGSAVFKSQKWTECKGETRFRAFIFKPCSLPGSSERLWPDSPLRTCSV